MCGIAGMIGKVEERVLRVMTQTLHHRGPDGGAIWIDGTTGFGHRRLKVIDLSDDARQPMLSDDGKCALSFNGEIFNYRELREELCGYGHRFHTASDAEVLLHACLEWGESVVDHLVGQFAFAWRDGRDGTLLIARDHLGVKPLYLAEHEGTLYFASEAKAILAVLPHTRKVVWEQVPRHLAFLWLPGSDTLFNGIRMLAPGNMLVEKNGRREFRCYWDPIDEWLNSTAHPGTAGERDEALRAVLGESVRSQLLSDVPLGLLLSGGLDSTILLALMRDQGSVPQAVTATYSDASRARDVFEDDLPYAEKAAGEFNAELHRVMLHADVIEVLPKVLWHLDTPLADPTVVTNFVLTKQAKRTHTVLLTGMGADELFAGYPRYPATMLGETIPGFPSVLLRGMGGLIRRLTYSGMISSERSRRPVQLLEHLHKNFVDRYIGYSSYADAGSLKELLVPELAKYASDDALFEHHRSLLERTRELSPLSRMLAVDLCTFLPMLNLENMDKTSMAHAVEMRVPFLDHRLTEFSMTLPDEDKLRMIGQRKVILKRAFAEMLPADILNRPKTGYSPPVRGWMRDSLRHFTEEMLLSNDSCSRDVFDRRCIQRMVEDNASGKRDLSIQLWTLLTFELWLRHVIGQTDWKPVEPPESLLQIRAKEAR